jgi:predicted exporter
VAGSESLSVLRQLAESVPGVLVVDPVGDVNRLMQRNRLAVSGLLLIGMVMAALFLAVTSGWRRSLRILMLPFLACAFSLAVVGYTRGSYSIVHVLALMLVIGVSLDFAIFRELTPKERQSATTLAIGLSALTSVLAFGMLGLSKTPLIAGFGQTIATGLLVAWGLSWIRSGPEPHGQ